MTPDADRRHVTLPSDLAAAREFQSQLDAVLAASAFKEAELFSIRMAIEEAVVNAIKHGNQMDPAKTVQISYTLTPTRFDIRISDQGEGFAPDDVPDPTDPDNLERPCGRGLFLMRHYMHEVEYIDGGRTVVMARNKATD